jgi:UDP-N-acetylglucosamine--N-acetylmuramyl-(pentapeptide) pyrophosphoryl-undecaprenol N-acetylglucosamine transferase
MKEKNDKKIVMTGGHAATTALSVAEELIRRSSSKRGFKWDIYWIGAKYALEGKKAATIESQTFPGMGIEHIPITAGRLQKKFTFWTIPSLAKIPLGFFSAFYAVARIQPDLVLSFGGFAAFPVVIAAYILRIPVVIHEQTHALGRANKYSEPFAEKVALAREGGLDDSDDTKRVVVGNPVMSQITEIKPKGELSDKPTIFITCGSRGSEVINKVVEELIDKLLDSYRVIHQTGPVGFKRISKKRDKMPAVMKENYEVYERIDPMQIDGVYKRADIIVARAGANTVSEIMIVKRPAILIPLPLSSASDQPANARMAQDFGIVKVINQDELSQRKLLEEINNLKENWKKMVDGVKDKKVGDTLASLKLVDLLEETLK